MRGKLITALGVTFLTATLMIGECRANEDEYVALANKIEKLNENTYCYTLEEQIAEIISADNNLKALEERDNTWRIFYALSQLSIARQFALGACLGVTYGLPSEPDNEGYFNKRVVEAFSPKLYATIYNVNVMAHNKRIRENLGSNRYGIVLIDVFVRTDALQIKSR